MTHVHVRGTGTGFLVLTNASFRAWNLDSDASCSSLAAALADAASSSIMFPRADRCCSESESVES